jgi:hypothetical protein
MSEKPESGQQFSLGVEISNQNKLYINTKIIRLAYSNPAKPSKSLNLKDKRDTSVHGRSLITRPVEHHEHIKMY